MSTVICIWDEANQSYIKKLAGEINTQVPGKQGNPLLKIINCQDELLSTGEVLREERKKDITEAAYMIILAELRWDGWRRASFRGLEIVKILRNSGIKIPIIVCSFADLEQLGERKEPKFQLLNTPGIFIFRLPSDKVCINEEQPFKRLTGSLLQDVNYYIFKISGRIDELFHDAKNHLGYAPRIVDGRELRRIEPILETFFEDIKAILPESDYNEIDEIKRNFIAEVEGKECLPGQILYNYKSRIATLIDSEDSSDADRRINVPWAVLYIEDDKETLSQVASDFKTIGIHCFTASNGFEAMGILRDDVNGSLIIDGRRRPPNTITVLITDWRLKSGCKWNYLQGYDIIDEVFTKHKNMLSFFVLTSKKGGILKQVQKLSTAKIQWYAKEDVINSKGSFNLFSDRVLEEGNNIYDELISRPSLSSWFNAQVYTSDVVFCVPLKEYYRVYRMSARYYEYEKNVSVAAKEFIDSAIELKQLINSGKDVEPLPVPYDLRQKLTLAPLDDDHNINEGILVAFNTKLILRRIIVGLWILSKYQSFIPEDEDYDFDAYEHFRWEPVEIAYLLKAGIHIEERAASVLEKKHGEVYDSKRMSKIFSDEKKQTWNSHLSLSTSLNTLIPGGLLVEEILWIKDYLGIQISRARIDYYKAVSRYLRDVQRILKENTPESLMGVIKDKLKDVKLSLKDFELFYGDQTFKAGSPNEARSYMRKLENLLNLKKVLKVKEIKFLLREELNILINDPALEDIEKEDKIISGFQKFLVAK